MVHEAHEAHLDEWFQWLRSVSLRFGGSRQPPEAHALGANWLNRGPPRNLELPPQCSLHPAGTSKAKAYVAYLEIPVAHPLDRSAKAGLAGLVILTWHGERGIAGESNVKEIGGANFSRAESDPTYPDTKGAATLAPSLSEASIISSRLPRKPSIPADIQHAADDMGPVLVDERLISCAARASSGDPCLAQREARGDQKPGAVCPDP